MDHNDDHPDACIHCGLQRGLHRPNCPDNPKKGKK
jgi:hypothetical protein